jgi:hypothetical protein
LQNQIAPSQAALNNAAVRIASTACGAAGPPNNVYGWGRVNILAAVTSGTPTPTPTATPTATPTPTPGQITLSARPRTRQGQTQVNLRWSPANGGTVNVLRNNVVVQTTPDDGKTKDNLGTMTGTFTYQVCETDTGDCSNQVQITVP